MKIFEFHSEGEKDWVTHENLLKAIQYYVSESGCVLSDIEDVVEVEESKWDSHTIINTDYCADEPDDKEFETFRQAMERLKGEPDILASTAY